VDLAGTIGAPDTRINPSANWSIGDFSFTALGRYISGQEEEAGGVVQRVASHFELDVQAAYNLSWDAQIVVGAQNVLNEEPELNADVFGWEPFDFQLYGGATLGTVPYIRYNQNF
ncbi:MAG: hypothetical protein AAGA84_12485, partial [Pseudomonadota bacterium]